MAFRLPTPASGALFAGLVAAFACVSASNVHALVPGPQAGAARGRVELENVEGGQTLVVLELDHLRAPAEFASELTEFVVWLEDAHGARVNLGALRYDRGRQAGNLMATTELRA